MGKQKRAMGKFLKGDESVRRSARKIGRPTATVLEIATHARILATAAACISQT